MSFWQIFGLIFFTLFFIALSFYYTRSAMLDLVPLPDDDNEDEARGRGEEGRGKAHGHK